MRKKLFKLFAVGAIPILALACASTASAKKDSTVALAAAHSALNLTQDVILQVECGKPGAPPEPTCVKPGIANAIHAKLAVGYKLHADAVDVVKALPPTLGTSFDPKVFEFVTKIWALVDEVRALFPQSNQSKALASTLDKLQDK